MLTKKLIQNNLQEIKVLVKLHETCAYQFKRLDELSDYIILSFGFITATILSLKPDDATYTTIGAVLSATATFLGTIKTLSGIKSKYGKSISVASHLRGIYHDTLVVLAKNHLTSDEYNTILVNLTHEINITTDALPILDAANELQGDSLLSLKRSDTPETDTSLNASDGGFHIKYGDKPVVSSVSLAVNEYL
jgi:hypothetical protein